MENNNIGKKCIFRGDRSGVFFGTLKQQEGMTVEMINFRKIYYWDGACAVEQIAKDGVKNTVDSKLTVWNEQQTITDCLQTIPCTKEAIKCIEAIKEWKK